MPANEIVEFAQPRFPAFAECYFYHCMTLPEVGEVGTEWDLRPNVAAYLGNTDFAGKRVLEIGPASGFLTMHMERAGADVISVDLPDSVGWDTVPRPSVTPALLESRKVFMRRLQNAFWFTHEKMELKSRLIYVRPQDLPDALGPFDVATITAVLIHTRDPLGILCRCAALRAKRIIVTEAI